MALFWVLALFIEYFIVLLFQSYGLTDAQTFRLSLYSFNFSVSPLFHLLPLGVIIVLATNWAYLTQYMAKVPRRRTSVKKRPKKRTASRFGRLGGALTTFLGRMKQFFLRFRGVSSVMRRLFFARAALKGAAIVVAIFLVSFVLVYLMGYPSSIHDLVVTLYERNSSLHGFVIGAMGTAASIGHSLAPIGGLASAVNGVLISVAPGFRRSLEGWIEYVTQPLVHLELVWIYILCQNLAAWISAISTLTYGGYSSRLYRRYRRR